MFLQVFRVSSLEHENSLFQLDYTVDAAAASKLLRESGSNKLKLLI